MAKTDIGPKISVDGESQYRKQMQNIIQQQKEYAAELNSATAALGKNSTAQERATSVASVLKKQIQNQESAISAQNLMLQKAVAKYGETSTQASRLRTSIYNTNTELIAMKSRLSDAENGLGEFADKAKDAEGGLSSFSDSAGSTDFSGLTKSIAAGNVLASAFKTIAKTAIDTGVQIARTGIEYNAQLEQYQVALTNMLGSEAKAVEVLNQIKEDAARTPFDTAGLVKANQLLISTGVDADASRKTILALGDAVSATGGGNDELSRMAQNLQQIRNAGKATAADIKQFAYAGIDVYGILADYTGKSTEEVQKMTVTYDVLTAALEKAAEEGGRYYNSMQTQSQTLNGQWNTLKDNATQLAGLMSEDLADAAGKVVSKLNEITVAAQEAYKEDGWVGLIGKVTGLSDVADRAKSSFAGLKAVIDSLKSGEIGIFHGDWDSVYQKAFNNNLQNQKAGKKDDNYWKQYGDRLAKQYGIESKKTGSASSGSASTASQKTQKAAADQKKLAKSVSDTNTELLEGTGNIVGSIKQVTETADNTYNVYDSTTGKIKGTTTETAQTITQTWTEMVNGVQKNYKKVVTLLDGVEQSSKTTSESVNQTLSSSNTSTEKLSGMAGVVGTLSRTTQTTQEVQKVWNEATGQMEDKVVSTGKVVTDTFDRINNGALEAVTQIKTFDEVGNLLSTKEQTAGIDRSKTSTSTLTEKIYGQEGVQGAIDRTTQTTREMQKVWNEATGEFEEKMVDTGKVVTDTFVRMNNGIAESVTLTTTYIGDEVASVSEDAQALNAQIVGIQGTVGGFTKFIYDLDTKLGGLEKVASNISNSPLKGWFDDISNGYRTDDSFFDNFDLLGTALKAGGAFLGTFASSGSWQAGLVSAGLSIVGSILGSDLSGLADESNGWGVDLVDNMANGMKDAGSKIVGAAKWVAEQITSFLHFSRPDTGPLREYEQWMPDMVKGMAQGIKDNAWMLRDAARGLSGQIDSQLNYDVGSANAAMSAAYTNRRISMGGVALNIYPPSGLDAEEVAQYTIDKFQQMVNAEAAANGEIAVF